MQGARDQLLAGAGFTGDQHRRARLREPPDGTEDFLHRRCLAENLGHFAERFEHRLLPLALIQRAADEFHRLVDVEGFWQVLIGAALEGGDRGFEVRVRGHHDHRHRRMLFLHLLQQLDA